MTHHTATLPPHLLYLFPSIPLPRSISPPQPKPNIHHTYFPHPSEIPDQPLSNMGGSDDHVLDLGLSLINTPTHDHLKKQPPTATARGSCYEPSLTLSLSGETTFITTTTPPPNKINHPPSSTPRYGPFDNNKLVCRTTAAEEAANSTSTQLASPQYCNSASAVSSVSYNMTSHVKRERETTVSDEAEVEKVESRGGGGGGGGVVVGGGSSDGDEEEEGNTRKKLRLTKDQSALLEESFKLHSTLNPKQKQALANQLNLRPRQVEVWFQNRRARTKLKQTEVDCEFLRKCCETLTEDNRRLQKELQELKAIKLAKQPFYMHLPAATLTMCPSCERVGTGGGTTGHVVGSAGSNSKLPFNTTATKSHHHQQQQQHHHQFYNSYTNPSAAC